MTPAAHSRAAPFPNKNNVRDENWDRALFAEIGSSSASMEAAKILDAYGLWQPTRIRQATGRRSTGLCASSLQGDANMGLPATKDLGAQILKTPSAPDRSVVWPPGLRGL